MASNPTTRMVSHVEEVDDAIIKEGIFRALEAKSKVTSPIASYSTAPSDNATLKHHPAPPSDSEAPGDSVKKSNLQPSLSTKDTPRDHTIPIMQLSSMSASKIACDSTVISPNVLIPSSAPYYAAKQKKAPAPDC